MKKISIGFFIIISIAFIFNSCGNRCSDAETNHCDYLAELYQYVGMYKPGNYWIYENKAGVKDSVFVSEYNVGGFGDEEDVKPTL